MKVYKPEISDGLALAIQDSSRFTAACQIQKVLEPSNSELLRTKLGESLGAEVDDAFDLYPVRTIMVTTGWNGNTDIFDQAETWAARSSPVNKPFNVGHIPRQIIGHIVQSYGMTETFDVLDDNTLDNNLPDKFHLVTDAVIYRQLGKRDAELTQEISDIIAGIENGDWYVSMECLFDGFDYGLRDLTTGEHSVVRRQESTAFLTKHLRQYRGSGTYANYEIGRVLRGITFSGKGLVEQPANPESVFIFNDVTAFANYKERDIEFLVANCNDTKIHKENSMAEATEQQIADLQRQLAEANSRLREMDEEVVKAKLDSKEAQITELGETIATLETRVTDLETSKADVDKQLGESNEANAGIQTKLDEASAELTKIEAAAKQTSRVSTLVDKGVDKAKAEEVVAAFATLDDDKFEVVVKMQSDIVAATTDKTDTTEESVADKGTEETEEEETEEESTAEETALENAEEVGDVDLASSEASASEEKEQATAQLASFLGSFLGNK